MSSEESTSPLKERIKRTPGQSTAEKLEQLRIDQIHAPIVCAFLLVIIIAVEWIKFSLNLPPHPYLLTALGYTPFSASCASIRVDVLNARSSGSGSTASARCRRC